MPHSDQTRRPADRRPRRIEWALTLLGAAALLATAWANLAFQRALTISQRNPQTQALFPWTVRVDLVLIVVLVAIVLYAALAVRQLSRDADALGAGRKSWLVPLALAAFALPFGLASLIGIVATYLALAKLGPRLAGTRDRAVAAAALAGWVVRVLVAFGLGAYGVRTNGEPVVLDDEMAYHQAARQVATILQSGRGDLDWEWRHLTGHFLDLMGLSYATLGEDFMLVRIASAALGAGSVLLVFSIAEHLHGPRVARLAAWLVALWPMLVFWGGTGLREPLAVFVSLAIPWLLVRHAVDRERVGWALAAVGVALNVVVLGTLRSYAAAAILTSLLVAAIATLGQSSPASARRTVVRRGGGAALLVAALVAGLLLAQSSAFREQFSPRALEFRAAALQYTPSLEHDPARLPPKPDPSFFDLGSVVRVRLPGRTDLETGMAADYLHDPPRYVVLVGDGRRVAVEPTRVERLADDNVGWLDVARRGADAAAVLLVPLAPWAAEPPQRRLSAPDTLAFDALLALALLGALALRRHPTAASVVVVVYPLIMTAGLAAFSTNLGTAIRHRSLLVPWLAILAAPLVASAYRYATTWYARRSTRAAVPVVPTYDSSART